MIGRPLLLPSSGPLGEGERQRPRTDFEVMAREMGAAILPPTSDPGLLRRVPVAGRLDWTQALTARRIGAPLYVSFSERVGIPLALVGAGAPHVMVAHQMVGRAKSAVNRATSYLDRVDRIVVFARSQQRHLIEVEGVSEDRARFVPDKVDAGFFEPGHTTRDEVDYIVSVGREQRDYETLAQAVSGTGIRTVIVPGSAWSTQGEHEVALPPEIEVRRGLSFSELRALYRGASLAIVPLQRDTDYAAGVNGVLEALACGLPTIVSATPGIVDYVDDGVTAVLTPAGDSSALHARITELWDDPGRRAELGRSARAEVERRYTIEHFVAAIGELAAELGVRGTAR